MIELKNIHKSYRASDETVPALNGIDIVFPDKGLCFVVGPSGCGKSTLLNVMGGLDHYDEGDIVIDGVSTKGYKDADWDSYRNHRIGFVFQSYSLIPHLSVLDNVIMPLSLSGESNKRKKELAMEMLKRVGLERKASKRPSQLSGGQQQRVAIARALVNDPDILLCDEPTGALDSKTSLQIMDLISEIARNRLVIMVTHNLDIASSYPGRIIEMIDGRILKDSKTFVAEKEDDANKDMAEKKTSMSFVAAMKSSVKNLLTKKGRTIATSLAGSIGIVGIGLVLSLSVGINENVSAMESDSLAGFPISIQTYATTSAMSFDYSDAMANASDFPEGDTAYSKEKESKTTHKNVLKGDFLDYLAKLDPNTYNSISYNHGIDVHVIYQGKGSYGEVPYSQGDMLSSFGLGSATNLSEIPASKEFVLSQYDVLAGHYPEKENEFVLILDKQNRLEEEVYAQLGYDVKESYRFEELLGKEFVVVGNDDYYQQNGTIFQQRTDYESLFLSPGPSSFSSKVTGILRVKPASSSSLLATGLNYTSALTDRLLKDAKQSQVVLAQEANKETNVLTGEAFNARSTYESNMLLLGGDDTPTGISIYPKSFEDKKKIKTFLDDYNVGKSESLQIIYSDLAESITATLTTVVNLITVVLSSIAAISLLVSSVMIAIIIYVSVMERGKEIGIMRALGARKKDITRIFSTEAIAIGFVAGALGVVLTYLLDLPLSLIIRIMLGGSFHSILPFPYALALLLLSMVLTFLAGIFPSLGAARKDPVEALRDK